VNFPESAHSGSCDRTSYRTCSTAKLPPGSGLSNSASERDIYSVQTKSNYPFGRDPANALALTEPAPGGLNQLARYGKGAARQPRRRHRRT
jgi:hypothetical protein